MTETRARERDVNWTARTSFLNDHEHFVIVTQVCDTHIAL